MDPYNEQVKSNLPLVFADIVLVSHSHYDHNNVELISGSPEVVQSPGQHTVKGICISGFSSFHDKSGGMARGRNIIFQFEIDGISFAHLGDLGTEPATNTMESLKNTDIIFIPVGGVFTINHIEAVSLIKKIQPKIAIPMHFKEQDTKVGVETINSFKSIASKDIELRELKKEFEISKETLPKETQIWIVYSS